MVIGLQAEVERLKDTTFVMSGWNKKDFDNKITKLQAELSKAKEEIERLEAQVYGHNWKEGDSVPACVNDCTYMMGFKLNIKEMGNLQAELLKAKKFLDTYFSKEEGVRYSKIVELEQENNRLHYKEIELARIKGIGVEEWVKLLEDGVNDDNWAYDLAQAIHNRILGEKK